MKSLSIKLFARARDLAGSPLVELPWSDGETVATLKTRLCERHPNLESLVARLLVAVNNNYAADDCAIRATDEVACFPPVSGG